MVKIKGITSRDKYNWIQVGVFKEKNHTEAEDITQG